jgi:release factor glutamine methyltransferase
VRRDAARRIGGATAALDARLLVAHALGMNVERVPAADSRVLTPRERDAIEVLVARRVAGEPVARIVGEKEFWGLPFRVTPAVLLPRPDTETLVAAVLAVAPRDQDLRILDIGTGSGAILLALLSELPRATGVGSDISSEAVRVAAENAARLGLAERMRFVETNWADGLDGTYHYIAANPPYIETATVSRLDPEVRDHDPRLALDGGRDGFDGHRAVLDAMRRLLAPDGRGFVEIGLGQGAEFVALGERAGFRITVHPDLAGIARVAEISR